MNALFFKYLFPVAVSIILLYSIYYILLRKEACFKLNRFFLLFALPCIHIYYPISIEQFNYQIVQNGIYASRNISPIIETKGYWGVAEIAEIVYAGGIALLLSQLLAQIVRILSLKKRFEIRKKGRYSIVYMKKQSPSFFICRPYFPQ